jgi:chromate transporter
VTILLPVGGAFADIAWFFSRLAVVTFGGAYAVLAYAAQEAVERYHWLSAPEMLTGLGLAETTPGPLILVLQFVGFLAGVRAPGALSGLWGGIAASVLTLWVTFAPCFTFVFLGAPLIERLGDRRRLGAALAAVTAAVVGVIGNLAVWFALHTLFSASTPLQAGWLSFDAPVLASIDPVALALALLAALTLLWLRRGVFASLAICAGASVALHLMGV